MDSALLPTPSSSVKSLARLSAVTPNARLAPSPTGLLHLGHARSFLLAWWSARSQGGSIRLRLEDLDTSRVRPEFIEATYEDLRWLGLDWDGEPLLQSDRAATLRETADQLLRDGLAYPCICTRSEIRDALSAPHGPDGSSPYPGTCRDRYATTRAAREDSGRDPALRFITPHPTLRITDHFAGVVELSPHADLGDFPITSRDGQVAYHLAVVLDDAHQGITEVLRGDDLMPSCGPQALLQAALDLPRPRWIHVPLVHGPDGERLAKRSDSLSLRAIRDAGVSPAHLVRWLALTCGLPDLGPCTPKQALSVFDLDLLPRATCNLPFDLLELLSRGELPATTPA